MRGCQQLLRRSMGDGTFSACLPAEIRTLEHAASGTSRTAAVDQITFPGRCRSAVHCSLRKVEVRSIPHMASYLTTRDWNSGSPVNASPNAVGLRAGAWHAC